MNKLGGLILLAGLSCGNSTFELPSGSTPIDPGPTPYVSPAPTPVAEPGELTARPLVFNSSDVRTHVSNHTASSVTLYLAVYVKEGGRQSLHSVRVKTFDAGKSGTISNGKIKDCADQQADLLQQEPPQTYTFPDRLPGALGIHLQFSTYRPDCEPCKASGPKECKEQAWDPVNCKWIGECCSDPSYHVATACFVATRRCSGTLYKGKCYGSWRYDTIAHLRVNARGLGTFRTELYVDTPPPQRVGPMCHDGVKKSAATELDCFEDGKMKIDWSTSQKGYSPIDGAVYSYNIFQNGVLVEDRIRMKACLD